MASSHEDYLALRKTVESLQLAGFIAPENLDKYTYNDLLELYRSTLETLKRKEMDERKKNVIDMVGGLRQSYISGNINTSKMLLLQEISIDILKEISFIDYIDPMKQLNMGNSYHVLEYFQMVEDFIDQNYDYLAELPVSDTLRGYGERLMMFIFI